MFCLSCGKKITENSKFCKYCGSSQTETDGRMEKKVNKKNDKYIWVCDFCGEGFETKEESRVHELNCYKNPNRQKRFFKNNSQRAWFCLWIITLLVFIVSLLINAKFDDYGINLFNSEFLSGLFFFNILVGINAFIAMAVSSIKKNNKVSFFTSKILIISLVYFLINTSVFAVEGFKAKNDEGYKNKYYVEITPTPTIEIKVTPTVIPTVIPKKTVKVNNIQNTNTKTNTNTNQGSQIDCTGPDGVVFKTTQVECDKFNSAWGYKKPTPTLNPREWIKCPISANCGGGNKEMTREECKRMICCETNNGWILTSDDVCNSTQHKESYNDWIEFCKGLYKDGSGICNSDCWSCIGNYKNPY